MGEKDITPTLQNALTREDGTIDADDPSKLIGCINALSKKVLGADEEFVKGSDPLPMRRAVAFCSSIKASKAIGTSKTPLSVGLPAHATKRSRLTGAASVKVSLTVQRAVSLDFGATSRAASSTSSRVS